MVPLFLLASGTTGLRAAGLVLLLVGLVACLVVARRAPVASTTEMPFWGHLEELRRRILASIAAWLAAATFAFSFGVGRWNGLPFPDPSVHENLAAQTFRALADHLVPEGVTLVVTRPMDAFMAEFGIALGLGVILALPIILQQLGGFAAPALKPAERRFLALLVIPLVLLFLAGCAFALLIVLPFTLEALYAFADPLGAQPLLGVGTLAGFALGFALAFGIAFQTPLVMVGLAKVGLIEPKTYVRYWRHSIVVIVVLSALLTPDPTLVSQVMMAGPLVLLYGLGIVWSAWVLRRDASKASTASVPGLGPFERERRDRY